jgi:hypothetical protein
MDLVMKVTKSLVINGYDFHNSLDHSIRLCVEMGKHTGVIHITPSTAQKYVWAHKVIQPWGTCLPLGCDRCGVLNPWKSTFVREGGREGYALECRNRKCGKAANGGKNVERHTLTILRPSDSDRLGGGKRSGWLRYPA